MRKAAEEMAAPKAAAEKLGRPVKVVHKKAAEAEERANTAKMKPRQPRRRLHARLRG